ncbi:MAG: hypothetical protein J6R29_04680 [Clostridia bacterium]|nr:hypothetical protein [Clostridia bacterium]
MAKLWSGRFNGAIDKNADDFNSSISFDKKMVKQDIIGSLAHVEMLCKQNIIEKEDYLKISASLISILEDVLEGALEISDEHEDVHSFVESELISRIG